MRDILKHIKNDIEDLKEFNSINKLEADQELKDHIGYIEELWDDVIKHMSSEDQMISFEEVLSEEGLTKPLALFAINNGYDNLLSDSSVSLQNFIDDKCNKEDLEVHLHNIITDTIKRIYNFIKDLVVKIAKTIYKVTAWSFKLLADILLADSYATRAHNEYMRRMREERNRRYEQTRQNNEDYIRMLNKNADKMSEKSIKERLEKARKRSEELKKVREEFEHMHMKAEKFDIKEQMKERCDIDYGVKTLQIKLNAFYFIANTGFDKDLTFMETHENVKFYEYLGYVNIKSFLKDSEVDYNKLKNIEMSFLFTQKPPRYLDKAKDITPIKWNDLPNNITSLYNASNYSDILATMKQYITNLNAGDKDRFEKEEKELLKNLETRIKNTPENSPEAKELLTEMKLLQKKIVIRSRLFIIAVKEATELAAKLSKINTFLREVVKKHSPTKDDENKAIVDVYKRYPIEE